MRLCRLRGECVRSARMAARDCGTTLLSLQHLDGTSGASRRRRCVCTLISTGSVEPWLEFTSERSLIVQVCSVGGMYSIVTCCVRLPRTQRG